MVLEMALAKTIQLRDLQQSLCTFFQQPFPKKLAKIQVYDKTYDDFMDYPFENVIGEEIEVTVTFEDTTDPYFYDMMDRLTMKYSIEDEMEWELETTQGDTCLTFKEWMKAKSEFQAVVPQWPPFDQ